MNFINSVQSLLAVTSTTSSSSKTTSSSPTFLIVLVVVFGVLYFFVIRPNSRRRMQTMRQTAAYQVGDEVVAGGMVGRVVRIGDGEVDIDAGDGVFTFVPGAVQSRAAYNASRARAAGGRGLGGGMLGRPVASSSATSTAYEDDEHEDEDEDDGDGDGDGDGEATGSAPTETEGGTWPSEGDSFGFGTPGPEKP